MKDLLYPVVALISAVVAVWQIWAYLSQNVPKGTESSTPMIIGIIFALIAIVCGGLFFSGKVNKTEEIHITE